MKAKLQKYVTGALALLVLLGMSLLTIASTAPQWGHASPLVPSAAEAEPNNTWAEANTFVIPGNMTGAITTTGDEDYFKISTTSGQVYTVDITRTSPQERRIDIYTNAYSWVASAETNSTQTKVSVTFSAQTTLYYIRVTAPNSDPTAGPTDYTVEVGQPVTPTSTPTNTPTPTATPLPPPPNIPVETEPNDNVTTADAFTVPGKVVGAITNTFDVDCFSINTTLGLQYRLSLQDYGFTRWLKVYDTNGYFIIGNTTSSTSHDVEITLQATFSRYYLCVSNVTTASPSNTIVDYLLEVIILQPTPTPTQTATPTATPADTPAAATPTLRPTFPSGFDAYEPNYTFSNASTIAPGLSYVLNFVPWGGGDVDNDYLRIRVKMGLQLTCETSDLDPGVDPRMVFYSGPGEQYYVMANDDIALGDFNSRLSYYTSYEGYVYILIGQGNRMDTRDTENSSYTLSCTLGVPGTQPGTNVTPVPDKDPLSTPRPTGTPYVTMTPGSPVSPIDTPAPPDTGDKVLDFRLITTPAPVTPTPELTGFRTFRVLIYYDENGDAQPGAGEGVPGFFISVLAPETKEELARGYTDDQGQLSFTVPTVGSVRVRIPLLGFDRLIEASKPEVNVRIAPPTLPSIIP